jgi:hypothetical protein
VATPTPSPAPGTSLPQPDTATTPHAVTTPEAANTPKAASAPDATPPPAGPPAGRGSDSSTRTNGQAADSSAPSRAGRGLAAAARLAAPALLAYAGMRLLGVAVLWWWAQSLGVGVLELLGERADATWYTALAQDGYDEQIPVKDGKPAPSNLAFFPLYPGLIRLVGGVLPVSLPNAGLLISWLAGLAAAWGIFAVGHRLYGRRVGTLLAVAWAVLPHAVVQSLAYTETLFTALAAWSLYAVLTRRWLTAAGLCVLAGLTRPTALALIAAITVAAALALWRRQDGWRPLAAAAIAPLGWLGYVAWVGQRLGRVDGWFQVQEFWNSSFDGGRYTLRTAADVLTQRNISIVLYVVTAVLAVGVMLLLISHRQPWPILVYSASFLVITLGGAGYYHAKARFLVPAFTLLLPVATALARLRTRTLAAVLTLAGLASAWFGGYLMLVWHASP